MNVNKELVKLELLKDKCDVYEKLINELDNNGNIKYSKDWVIKQIFGYIL